MHLPHMLKQAILRPAIGRKIIYRYFHHLTNCYVISYPKCGRTWLRVMLAKAIALHYGNQQDLVTDPFKVVRSLHQKGPYIQFTHDGIDRPPTIQDRPKNQFLHYSRKKVLFLVRDPKDALVSYYFHRTRRLSENYDISEFIRHPWWGIERIINFMVSWYRYRDIPKDFIIIRYEDLHHDINFELHRILEFVGLKNINEKVIHDSIEYASFENMRKISIHGPGKEDYRLAPTNIRDPESFKVRSGKVGGYKGYLTIEDILYINKQINRQLPLVFGYNEKDSSHESLLE